MTGFPHIKKFLREATHYPSKKVVYVEKINIVDNKLNTYEAFVGKDEAELIKYMIFNLKDKISNKEMDKLWNLIEEYGNERAQDAYDDAAMDAAGEDL